MKFITFVGLILVGIGLTTAADVFLKKSMFHDIRYLVAGILIYAMVGIPVALAFRLSSFGSLFLVWEGGTVVIGLVTALVYFGEPLSINRILALIFAVLALIFSYWPKM